MVHAHKTLSSTKPPQEVFDYLADFANTAQWDPGITAARRLDDGPIGVGNRFEIDASFFGRTITMLYQTTLFEPPERFVVRGESSSIVSVDAITVEPQGSGSLITYDAELTLRGALEAFDPALALGFNKVANKALLGLSAALSA